jgi:hypothetical protein
MRLRLLLLVFLHLLVQYSKFVIYILFFLRFYTLCGEPVFQASTYCISNFLMWPVSIG